MASLIDDKRIITLGNSTAIVSEFFGYAANCILYNRGLYPAESFAKVNKYGLPMMLTQDSVLKPFIANLTADLAVWLEAGHLHKIVLVIMKESTEEAVERWSFGIETDSEVVNKGGSREKSRKKIVREIQTLIRQIVSSITFLPRHNKPLTFCVEATTSPDAVMPDTWTRCAPKLIDKPQKVKLSSFDTKVHKVGAMVSFKSDDWDDYY